MRFLLLLQEVQTIAKTRNHLLEMMVTFGGKERTEQEFATLLSGAGLTLEQVMPINGNFFSVVEATPCAPRLFRPSITPPCSETGRER